MKKFLLTLTSVTLCLTLVACGGEDSASSTPATTQEIVPAQSTDTPAPSNENAAGGPGEGMTGERGEGMMADRGEAMGSGDQMMAMLPEGTQLPDGFAEMTNEEKQAALADLGIDMEAMMSDMMANRGERPEGMEDMEGMERPEGMEGGAGQMMPMLPEGVELPEGFADMSEEEKQAVLAELGIDLEAMMGERGERTEGMDMGERPAQ